MVSNLGQGQLFDLGKSVDDGNDLDDDRFFLDGVKIDPDDFGISNNAKKLYDEVIQFRTKPPLKKFQKLFASHDLNETEANRILADFGYPEISAYLAVSLAVNYDFCLDSDFNLRELMTKAIHSEVLGIDIEDVGEQIVSRRRPNELSQLQFERFQIFVEHKILPLVRNHRYPTVAIVMIDEIISPYTALDSRSKSLFKALIHEAARAQPVLLSRARMLNKGMAETEQNPQHDAPPGIREKIDQIIADLRSNHRIQHPTMLEVILTEFIRRGCQPISMEELGKLLYGDASNAEREAQNKISRLNEKLEQVGLKVVRKTTYALTGADNK